MSRELKPEIIAKLLQINRDFYAQLADPFAQSRRQPQPGFTLLADWLPATSSSLLDVGCGEGRLGRFIQEQHPLERYVGVDFTAELLDYARHRTKGEFKQRDISKPDCLAGLGTFDVVACLATMQHIPGYANRIRLLREMKERLEGNGRLFLANWQFMDSPRQRRKVRPWSEVNLTGDDLEPGDYLLTWQRSGYGLRYVCQIDVAQTARMANEAGLRIIQQFRSDGKEGDLSLYTIFEKANIKEETSKRRVYHDE